jgi:protein-glucosylgalactosylhydroxylysine glucosidase
MSFEFTRLASTILGKTFPESWIPIMENLKIPFNTEEQIHLEYDGYTDEEIKQADVILLGFPLMFNMTSTIRANDLDFYSPLTDASGPAMTWSMTAVGYIDTKDYVTAQKYFIQGFANAQEPFQVWTETPTGVSSLLLTFLQVIYSLSSLKGAVNFITGCGGFLQSVMFGYPTMRLHDDFLSFEGPVLPSNVTAITLRALDYRGSQIDIRYDASVITFTLISEGPVPLFASEAATAATLRPSLSQRLSLGSISTPLMLNRPTSFLVTVPVVLFGKN